MSEVPLHQSVHFGTGRAWAQSNTACYRGTSLIRNHAPLGPYIKYMPGALWCPWESAVSYEPGLSNMMSPKTLVQGWGPRGGTVRFHQPPEVN